MEGIPTIFGDVFAQMMMSEEAHRFLALRPNTKVFLFNHQRRFDRKRFLRFEIRRQTA
jgi:hypothetical protein